MCLFAPSLVDINKRVGEFQESRPCAWRHRLNGHEFEEVPGDDEGQGSLACCSPWGHKELDMTERLKCHTCWRTFYLLALSSGRALYTVGRRMWVKLPSWEVRGESKQHSGLHWATGLFCFALWGLQVWCLDADHHSFLRKIRKLSLVTWGFLLYPFPKHCFSVCVLTHVWLCDPMDFSFPGSSVHGILQARIGTGCHFLLQETLLSPCSK